MTKPGRKKLLFGKKDGFGDSWIRGLQSLVAKETEAGRSTDPLSKSESKKNRK